MSVVVHVEELVLSGFARRDAHRIAAELSLELERLIAAHGVPPGLLIENGAALLSGAALTLPPGAPPEWVGQQLARSVYSAADRNQNSRLPAPQPATPYRPPVRQRGDSADVHA